MVSDFVKKCAWYVLRTVINGIQKLVLVCKLTVKLNVWTASGAELLILKMIWLLPFAGISVMRVGVMKTVTLAKTVIKKKMEAGTAHQNALKNVETDAQIVLSAIWPWILVWHLVTLDGVKKTVRSADTLAPWMVALMTVLKNAKIDVMTVLSV